jgi:predicted DNA-binding protein
MASTDKRRGDRHVHHPLAYRVPADVRPRLEARMEQTGRGASAIISEALRRYLSDPEAPVPANPET